MLKNSRTSWGKVSRWFHWGTVLLIVIQIPLGFYLVEVYDVYKQTYGDDTQLMRVSNWHNTLGFVVLIVVTARLLWRVSQSLPDATPGLAAYQRVLSYLTHITLYVLLLLYPLSGWAALSAYEFDFPIFFFGWDSVPGIVPSVKEGEGFDYPFFAGIHKLCWKIGAGVLGLHVIAALWHQYVRRDNVLRRMVRGSDGGGKA